MPPEEQTAVQDALQKRDIDDLKKAMVDGFAGMHQRQDTTNGKVLKNTSDITELQTWNKLRLAEQRYNKFIWYILTLTITIIASLLSYIVYHH